MKSGTQLLNVRSSGVKLKIIISGEISVVFNAHCSSASHPEDQISRKHNQQIMSRSWTDHEQIMDHYSHDPSLNVPQFWRHERTTFYGFIKATKRLHMVGGTDKIGEKRETTKKNKQGEDPGGKVKQRRRAVESPSKLQQPRANSRQQRNDIVTAIIESHNLIINSLLSRDFQWPSTFQSRFCSKLSTFAIVNIFLNHYQPPSPPSTTLSFSATIFMLSFLM